jgi:hypothetical protein
MAFHYGTLTDAQHSALERDHLKLNRHRALDLWWSMIFRKTGIHPSGQARGHAFPDHALMGCVWEDATKLSVASLGHPSPPAGAFFVGDQRGTKRSAERLIQRG